MEWFVWDDIVFTWSDLLHFWYRVTLGSHFDDAQEDFDNNDYFSTFGANIAQTSYLHPASFLLKKLVFLRMGAQIFEKSYFR